MTSIQLHSLFMKQKTVTQGLFFQISQSISKLIQHYLKYIGRRGISLESLGRNRIALARNRIPFTAISARSAVLEPIKTNRKDPLRIGLQPYEREARGRRADVKLKSFGLIGGYEEYGSTDGDWRQVPANKRFILPPGCAPRRSRRLNG